MTITNRRLLPSSSALAAFDSVARLGSVSEAARELSLTQGAISRQIASLEEQLGTQLFQRHAKGLTLTATAERYSASIAEALDMIRNASLDVMTNSQGRAINLATLPTFGTRWLMPRLSKFVAVYPGIFFNFATRIGKFDLIRDGFDAAIHVGKPDWPGADCHFLMGEKVVPVCSPGLLAGRTIADPQQLASLPLFSLSSRPDAWNTWFATFGPATPKSASMSFEQFTTATQACIAGLGVILMPTFLIEPELESGQLVKALDLEIESGSEYYLVTPSSRTLNRSLTAFRDWLVEEAGSAST